MGSFNISIFVIGLLGKFMLDLVDGDLFLCGSNINDIRKWIGECQKLITVGRVFFDVGDWVIFDWITYCNGGGIFGCFKLYYSSGSFFIRLIAFV